MDTAEFAAAFSPSSIVAWFALLVVVFAVFVGLGLYQSLRRPTTDDEVSHRRPAAPERGPHRHRKE